MVAAVSPGGLPRGSGRPLTWVGGGGEGHAAELAGHLDWAQEPKRQ